MPNSQHFLAQVRTLMANERTLLSYYRSALAMVGLAAFVFKFYVSDITTILSGAILVLAVVVAIYGTARYFSFKRLILEKSEEKLAEEL